MMELPENYDSIFRYIAVVSQRAEQLINGARSRADSPHAKPTLQAKADVDAGLVGWRMLTQEELDAQRQAIVDQFRAEVGAEELGADLPRLVPDVLPIAALGEDLAVEADEDGDDELDRLQRLLGMVRGGATRGGVTAAEISVDDLDVEGEAENGDLALDLEEEPEGFTDNLGDGAED